MIDKLQELAATPLWEKNLPLHRVYLLSCWLLNDGQRLTDWLSFQNGVGDLLGLGFGLQALMAIPLTAGKSGSHLCLEAR